jgi:hypothetical protein
MILALRSARSTPPLPAVPARRRVIVLGATEAGVSAAFHLGKSSMLIELRGISADGGQDVERDAVVRWQPPEFTQSSPAEIAWNAVWQQMLALLSGETRLSTRVVAIDTAARRLQLSTGESFVYDKLVCTLPLHKLVELLVDEERLLINDAEWWRCWLGGRDIEMLDEGAQKASGDLSEEGAGKRVADSIRLAMSAKYSIPRVRFHATPLFQPRVV